MTQTPAFDLAGAVSYDRPFVPTSGDPTTLKALLETVALALLPSMGRNFEYKTIEVDIRETRFAGGAKCDNVNDDAAAIQAAIDFFKPYSQYQGGAPVIRVPRGRVKVGSEIDVTGCHGLTIRGEGRGSTQIVPSHTGTVIKADTPAGQTLNNLVLKEFTIYGIGYTNVNAHGIDLKAPNNCLIDVRVWRCRDAIRIANAWQTTIFNPRIDGLTGLECFRGLVMLDGVLAVAENAVLILGGVIQGTISYGFRGECVTGSKVFGLEVVGCGNTGVYIGDSPGLKDVKWFTWVGGLVDTCPDLILIKRGGSAVGTLIHFSGMWLGYASGGNGVGVDIRGMDNMTFSADIIANTKYAANLENCDRITFVARTIKDYDRTLSGSAAIIVNGTTKSRIDVGTTKKAAGATSTVALVEQGAANYNLITGIFDGAVNTAGAQSNKAGAMANVP